MKHYKIKLIKADSFSEFGPAWFKIYNARGRKKLLAQSNTIFKWEELYIGNNRPAWHVPSLTEEEAERIFKAGYEAWRAGNSREVAFTL